MASYKAVGIPKCGTLMIDTPRVYLNLEQSDIGDWMGCNNYAGFRIIALGL
jgi:hypothetical protein